MGLSLPSVEDQLESVQLFYYGLPRLFDKIGDVERLHHMQRVISCSLQISNGYIKVGLAYPPLPTRT